MNRDFYKEPKYPIETIFCELLWQRAAESGISNDDLLKKDSSYQDLKESIIKELKSSDHIEVEIAQMINCQHINQQELNCFLESIKDTDEENRIIERAIFIEGQERSHNEDELNDDR